MIKGVIDFCFISIYLGFIIYKVLQLYKGVVDVNVLFKIIEQEKEVFEKIVMGRVRFFLEEEGRVRWGFLQGDIGVGF